MNVMERLSRWLYSKLGIKPLGNLDKCPACQTPMTPDGYHDFGWYVSQPTPEECAQRKTEICPVCGLSKGQHDDGQWIEQP